MYYVYRIINLVNGKSYIGITGKTVEKRWKQHSRSASKSWYASYNTVFAKAIRKYGVDMFRTYTLVSCENHISACAEEIRLIGLLHPEYNLTTGGEGATGVKYTDERRAKISKFMKNRSVGPETRAKIAAHMKKRYIKPETIAKMTATLKAKPKPTGVYLSVLQDNVAKASAAVRVPVRCITDGNIFNSVTAAAKFYGVPVSKITCVCRGQRNHTGGYKFTYAVN